MGSSRTLESKEFVPRSRNSKPNESGKPTEPTSADGALQTRGDPRSKDDTYEPAVEK